MNVYVSLVNNREITYDYFENISLDLTNIKCHVNDKIKEEKSYGCAYDAWVCELLNPYDGILDILNLQYNKVKVDIIDVQSLQKLSVI